MCDGPTVQQSHGAAKTTSLPAGAQTGVERRSQSPNRTAAHARIGCCIVGAEGISPRPAKGSSGPRVQFQDGRIDEGAELANQVAGGHSDPVATAQLRIMLSTIGLMRCRWEEATSHASAVLSEPGLAEHLYAEAKLAQLRSFLSEGNEIGLRSLVASIMGGDNRIGESAALGAALVVSAKWAWDAGRPADTVAFLRAAVARS